MEKRVMKTRSGLFSWLACIAVLIAIVWFIIGCDIESPEARFASSIKSYNVDGPIYDRVKLNGDQVQTCETDFAACFVYADGTLIDVGGLKFTQSGTNAGSYQNSQGYWYPTDKMGSKSSFVTEESGYCLFTNWCSIWGVYFSQSTLSARGKNTETVAVSNASYYNWNDPGTGKLIAWYGVDSVYKKWTGGHYHSGGPSSLPSIAMANVTTTPPQGVSSNLSQGDTNFLADTSIVSIGTQVHSVEWNRRAGGCGQGYSKPALYLTPLDNSEPNIIAYKSTPYFLSVNVGFEEPITDTLLNVPMPVKLYKGDVFLADLNMEIKSISDDKKRAVIQTEYIVPIETSAFIEEDVPSVVYDRWTPSDDPNIFVQLDYADPNTAPDPNFVNEYGVILSKLDPNKFVPVHCVPLNAGEKLKIRIDNSMLNTIIPRVSESWLTNDRNLDRNNDGIVNLKDLQ